MTGATVWPRGVLLALACAGCGASLSASPEGDVEAGVGVDGDRAERVDADLEIEPEGSADADESPSCLEVSPPGEILGSVDSSVLAELSGLVAGRAAPEVLWVHNDSGDGPRLFAVTTAGELRGTFTLAGAIAVDWEDIAADETFLYVGDIGDNDRVRETIAVHRVSEPSLPPEPIDETVEDYETVTLVYPDGAHNAETLLVDPVTGDLFVVTKARDDNRVYRAAAPLPWGSDEPVSLELVVGALPFEQRSPVEFYGGETTGGDISPNGEGILIRDYWRAFYWPRWPDQSVDDALAANEPCEVPLTFDGQGEAIGFEATGRVYITIPEQTPGFGDQPIRRYE